MGNNTKQPLLSIERDTRHDQRGFTVRVRGYRVLAFNHWRVWRPQGRDGTGFLFQAKLPCKMARGSMAWRNLPTWKRWTYPPNWIQRTLYFGWRARGGKGPTHGPWPKLRVGFARVNDVPYSFK